MAKDEPTTEQALSKGTRAEEERTAPPADTAPAAAPAAAAPQANVVNLSEARAEGEAAAYERVREITELCTIAGAPELAHDFITKRTPVAEVRKALLDQRASAEGAGEVVSRHAAAGARGAKRPPIDYAKIYGTGPEGLNHHYDRALRGER